MYYHNHREHDLTGCILLLMILMMIGGLIIFILSLSSITDDYESLINEDLNTLVEMKNLCEEELKRSESCVADVRFVKLEEN